MVDQQPVVDAPESSLKRSPRERIPSPRYSPNEHVLLSDRGEPESFDEAMESEEKEKWFDVMEDEIKSLHDNHTFDLMSSIHVVLGLASSLDLEVEKMDVKTAFVHGDLDEEIYMKKPKEKYIQKELQRLHMDKAKVVNTPLAMHFKLSTKHCPSSDDENEDTKKVPYASAFAELIAVVEAYKEFLWMKKFLEKLGCAQERSDFSYTLDDDHAHHMFDKFAVKSAIIDSLTSFTGNDTDIETPTDMETPPIGNVELVQMDLVRGPSSIVEDPVFYKISHTTVTSDIYDLNIIFHEGVHFVTTVAKVSDTEGLDVGILTDAMTSTLIQPEEVQLFEAHSFSNLPVPVSNFDTGQLMDEISSIITARPVALIKDASLQHKIEDTKYSTLQVKKETWNSGLNDNNEENIVAYDLNSPSFVITVWGMISETKSHIDLPVASIFMDPEVTFNSLFIENVPTPSMLCCFMFGLGLDEHPFHVARVVGNSHPRDTSSFLVSFAGHLFLMSTTSGQSADIKFSFVGALWDCVYVIPYFPVNPSAIIFLVPIHVMSSNLCVWDLGIHFEFRALTGYAVDVEALQLQGCSGNYGENVEELLLLECFDKFFFIAYSNSMSRVWDPGQQLNKNDATTSTKIQAANQVISLLLINLTVPEDARACLNLEDKHPGDIYLDQNQLSGSLPNCLGNITSLREIHLSSNKLSSNIPPSLGNLQDLVVLDLSSNNMVGSLPPEIGNLKAATLIDLSMNQFSNRTPREIGGLQNLAHLSLRQNNLQGAIPDSMSNMVGLEFLDLSQNNIYGIIPKSLEKLQNLKYRRGKSAPQQAESLSTVTRERISYYELLQAMDDLSESNLIGIGGFGSVYKGVLRSGTVIAVKVFNLQLDAAFKSFDTECEVLCSLRHRNLVKSLRIMINVASALEYLHHGCSLPLIHCDVKPSNVLLDDDMVSHLSDFGISKLLGEDQEYGLEGLCQQSVTSMLLETFTRRKPNEFEGDLSLKQWASYSLQDNCLEMRVFQKQGLGTLVKMVLKIPLCFLSSLSLVKMVLKKQKSMKAETRVEKVNGRVAKASEKVKGVVEDVHYRGVYKRPS
ncbi:hypothetical protein T459_11483 [Capsicum annuum]|uniref:Protein kinase domain-containing protein n=1 Tax=Capsicum annuum TaxID=4072 RepID=A0A2G2ZM17_CAPAN|nr:hypothetical protein T459_11483 [Capsicum annuum]